MPEPNRTSNGVAYMTFDATLNTNASMIAQQKLDLSGNTTARTFCVDAFNLSAKRDISGSLLTDSEITDYESNNLVYLGSNDVNVQKTFLNNKINASIAQHIACNAYNITLGRNNQIPIVSNLQSEPEPEPEPEPIPEPEPEPEPVLIISYNISTIATGLNQPWGVAADSSGNVYIADRNSHSIKKIDASTGIISTIAGTGSRGYSGDGRAATSAQLNEPIGVALDSSGNVYISDTYNHRIRMIDVSTGIISLIAGTGSMGYSGDGGTATSTRLYYPAGVALDSSGNVYIADIYNNRIRKVSASDGKISTIAGTGSTGYSGDGGAATSAKLYYPYGVALDSSGNVYIADTENNRIRKVSASDSKISTIATGLNVPHGLASDSYGNVYIADSENNRIQMIDVNGVVSTIAGTGSRGYSGDGGAATSAQLKAPRGVALDSSGNVYIGDYWNDRIRKLTPIYGVLNN